MAELHVFAEWAPACVLDERTEPGRRSLREALAQVGARAREHGVTVRVHAVLPLLAAQEPIGLPEQARFAEHLGGLGMRLSLWPVVERRRGYFLGARTARVFEARLADLGARLAAAGLSGRVGVTVDLEPPLPLLLRRWWAPLDPPDRAALARVIEHLRGLRDAGVIERLQAAVIPGVTPPVALDDLLLMTYGSMPDVTGRLEVAYPLVSALLCKVARVGLRFGPRRRRVVMALGLLNHGVLRTEPTFRDPHAFARAVALTHDEGDAELAVYGLCGLLCGHEGLVTPDPELVDRWEPIAPRFVRGESELDRWLLPLLRRVAARSGLPDAHAER